MGWAFLRASSSGRMRGVSPQFPNPASRNVVFIIWFILGLSKLWRKRPPGDTRFSDVSARFEYDACLAILSFGVGANAISFQDASAPDVFTIEKPGGRALGIIEFAHRDMRFAILMALFRDWADRVGTYKL